MTQQATQVQIEQANDMSYIRELHSAAKESIADDWEVDKALDIIELIEEGKYLEAVMVEFNF